MTWPAIVLLVGATALATAGAILALGQERTAPEEAAARRAIIGLGVLAAAVALAAFGGAFLAADETRPAQVGAFGGAAATVALPLLVVGLVRRGRRFRGLRPSGGGG
jgi:hypothetical protein